MKLSIIYSSSLIIGSILYTLSFSITAYNRTKIILLSYTISIMGIESLFIIDDSPDDQLESTRQQGVSNGPVFLNKFVGAQMEHE